MIEKHYTHSRFQFSVFTKSFFYMLLNILIIPGITLSTASKFKLKKFLCIFNYKIKSFISF